MNERPRSYLKVSEAKRLIHTTNTSEALEERLLDLIFEASALLERLTGRRFDRRLEGRYRSGRAMANGGHVYDGNVISTGDDLQALASVTNGGGASIDLNSLELRRSPGAAYYAGVALMSNSIAWESDPDGLRQEAVLITGEWGYGGRWKLISTLGAAVVSTSATSITVQTDAHANFEQEMLLKIDSEYLIVDNNEGATPAVNVERGVNGTEAATHLINAPIYTFEPDRVVQRFIKRVVQWYDALDDAPLYGTVQVGDISVPVDLTSIPKDVTALTETLSRIHTIGRQ